MVTPRNRGRVDRDPGLEHNLAPSCFPIDGRSPMSIPLTFFWPWDSLRALCSIWVAEWLAAVMFLDGAVTIAST